MALLFGVGLDTLGDGAASGANEWREALVRRPSFESILSVKKNVDGELTNIKISIENYAITSNNISNTVKLGCLECLSFFRTKAQLIPCNAGTKNQLTNQIHSLAVKVKDNK